MKNLFAIVLFLALASPLSAQADLWISATPATGATSCNFFGLPASIPATNIAVANGACMVDIQSLLGTSGTYSVTANDCVAVTGTGIPAGTEVCSGQSPPLAFTLPAVTPPTVASAPALAVH
jgi:hypothetical protein